MAADKNTEDLSPFELKDILIKMASSDKDRLMLNAGRGNPNFVATQARHGFLRIGDFAMREAERSYSYLNASFGGMPETLGIVERFDAYALYNKGAPGIEFINAVLSFADDHLGMDKGELLHEMTEAFLGCNYPVPPKMLPLCQQIVKVYLSNQMCAGQMQPDDFDIFATEGGTAAMTYIFETCKANGILGKRDKIGIITPIFSPYLEIPRVPEYDLEIVEIKADESKSWQIPDKEIKKLLDPEIKLLFMVNPSNPPSVKMSDTVLKKLSDLVNNKRKDLMIVTDDVYGTFADDFLSIFSICPYNTLCVYSFSKYFGATGWRLGAIMLSNDNIFDNLIRNLSSSVKGRLNKRYSSLTDNPGGLKFIDRLVADSRAVALNHTAGLSCPQQLQMMLFAVGNIIDERQEYKADAKRVIRRRFAILHDAIGYTPSFDNNSVEYYSVIDLELLSKKLYGVKFSKWLMTKYTGTEFIMRLAKETGVVLLPGKGFEVDHPSVRVSLANLSEHDYRAIGLSVKKIMAEFKGEFKSK